MNELHIHEVLRMMIETGKTYTNRADFVQDITAKFGKHISFYACSGSNMDANEAFDFLIRKGKIRMNDEQGVAIDPDMTMCDDDRKHEH